MSEERTLFDRLLAAQQKMGVIVKDEVNPFYNSKYADINTILKEVLPILNAEGILLMQPLTHVDGKPAMKTILMHGTEKFEFETVFPEFPKRAEGKSTNTFQDMGKGATYLRRISLQTLAALMAQDDDGNAMTQSAPKKDQQKAQPTEGAKEVPRCSICGEFMRQQKNNPDKYFCKHESNGSVTWGKPVSNHNQYGQKKAI